MHYHVVPSNFFALVQFYEIKISSGSSNMCLIHAKVFPSHLKTFAFSVSYL